MKSQTPYRYSILRYMYDVRTQEFLNVGILFHAPQEAFLRFRGIEKTGQALRYLSGYQSAGRSTFAHPFRGRIRPR